MKYIQYFLSVTFLTIVLARSGDDTCDICVRREQCPLFQRMTPTQQYIWVYKYPCTQILYNGYYIPYSNNNYICCSDKLWAAETVYGNDYNKINTENQEKQFLITMLPDNKQIYQYTPSAPSTVDFKPNAMPKGIDRSDIMGPTHLDQTLVPTPVTNQPQCIQSSFPPSPETGCCGLEASELDRIDEASTALPVYPYSPYFMRPEISLNEVRIRRQAGKLNVTIDNRIAGGHETELYQFPWTVQLMSTFDYGQRRQPFDCGGALISSRYVLTAGHCMYDANGPLIKVEAFLAEYDRTTFPRDCKNYGQECIENVVIDAEDVILHSQYDEDKLFNDIALIRLRVNAPYTAYIRPICLTPIDVDNTNFANLRLAVAGWGRTGRTRSNIKQSTVVNLVPQEQCKMYYPSLIRSQLCAVGFSGEDTCKGDSGGPLMMLNGGKYYVVGLVSGKRKDAPCGTAVPSLYTNVFQYTDWILANIRD